MIGRRTPQLPHSFSSLYNTTYSLSGWRKLILRPGCAHEISLRERIRHDSSAIRGPFKVSIDIAANLLSLDQNDLPRPPLLVIDPWPFETLATHSNTLLSMYFRRKLSRYGCVFLSVVRLYSLFPKRETKTAEHQSIIAILGKFPIEMSKIFFKIEQHWRGIE